MPGQVTASAISWRAALVIVIASLAQAVLLVPSASAQDRPRPAFEGAVGWAGFEDFDNHVAVGGSTRFYLTPRLAFGPEVFYLVGPGDDRDLMVTGNLTFDLLEPPAAGRLTVNPYLVVGAGLFHHRDRFNSRSFSSTEGGFTGGGGARIFVTDGVYVAPDFRIGWELHVRATIAVGVQLGN